MGKRPMAFLFFRALSRRGHRAAGPQPYSIGMLEKADQFLDEFSGASNSFHRSIILFPSFLCG
jgi:hypothetical protein